MKNCVEGLSKIIPTAARVCDTNGIIQSTRSPRLYVRFVRLGSCFCKAIGSDHFKLLYDIYHMQIQRILLTQFVNNTNILDTITQCSWKSRNRSYTKLNYTAIAKAIHETGFDGYLAQEFVPKAEQKMTSLQEAILICDV